MFCSRSYNMLVWKCGEDYLCYDLGPQLVVQLAHYRPSMDKHRIGSTLPTTRTSSQRSLAANKLLCLGLGVGNALGDRRIRGLPGVEIKMIIYGEGSECRWPA